jgi:ESCRT-I complex subunit VPS37
LFCSRREDLEDLIANPQYFQAVFHSLERVKNIYRAQDELVKANESIAKNNLALQEQLYKLRSDTKEAFDEAKRLEARWKELEREQKEVYQVCLSPAKGIFMFRPWSSDLHPNSC